MSFQKGYQGLFCPFKAAGYLDITMYQHFTIRVQLGSKHVPDNYPTLKDGKSFEYADISTDHTTDDRRSCYDGSIATGKLTDNDLARCSYGTAQVTIHPDETIDNEITAEGTIRTE